MASLAVAGVFLSLTPAQAATVYDWTISGGDGADGALSGSGTITLSSTPTVNDTGTGFLVTAMTGTLTSNQFSSTVSSIVGPNFAVDDLVYPSAPVGFILDDFGLGIALADNIQLDFGAQNGQAGFYDVSCCGSNEPIYSYPHVTFGLTAASATPEPSTWAMMLLGFCGLGVMLRQKKAVLRVA